MLIGDTFLPLFGLDQDRICFISEIALDCAMVRLENIHITFDPHPHCTGSMYFVGMCP